MGDGAPVDIRVSAETEAVDRAFRSSACRVAALPLERKGGLDDILRHRRRLAPRCEVHVHEIEGFVNGDVHRLFRHLHVGWTVVHSDKLLPFKYGCYCARSVLSKTVFTTPHESVILPVSGSPWLQIIKKHAPRVVNLFLKKASLIGVNRGKYRMARRCGCSSPAPR